MKGSMKLATLQNKQIIYNVGRKYTNGILWFSMITKTMVFDSFDDDQFGIVVFFLIIFCKKVKMNLNNYFG